MKRTKIGNGYFRNGYSRTSLRKATIYLIDGYAYAKDKETAETQFDVLKGELEGYVRVNCMDNTFAQCNDKNSSYLPHLPFTS